MTNTNSPIFEILESGIAKITLGQPEESVLILTEERLLAFEKLLDQIKKNLPIGLIITGSSENMFSAGADINVIQSVKTAEEGARLAKQGQDIFKKIEDLDIISIAAISGPCVGGACELALACDFRIISDYHKSAIGLPEIKIGILPGFGGTQRLPRIIGVPNALDIILKGKIVKAKDALKIGLVSKVCSYDNLIKTAENIILDATPLDRNYKFKDKLLTKFKPLRNIAFNIAKKNILQKTKGHYPAPLLALETIKYGLDSGISKGYENEARNLGKLIVTPECKALTNLFFLTESAKSIGKSAVSLVNDLNAVTIGAGIMGAGIASEFARIGFNVFLKDVSLESVEKGKLYCKKIISENRSINEIIKKDIIARIQGGNEFPKNIDKTDLIIEAIFEDLVLKKKILSEVAEKIKSTSIIATNTSSLSVTEIAKGISNPERVVGMHFFNPVHRMPLVEIVRGKDTNDEVVCMVAAIASKMGKFPIVVNDVPGFLVNRILSPYLNEAMFLLEEGYKIEDIDKAALKFGMPMGPIRLLDEIGLDVAAHVYQTLITGYGKRMQAPQFTKTLLDQGRKGKKTNQGFYNYLSGKAIIDKQIYEILNITSNQKADMEHLQNRLIMSLVNEAVLCLDEGVAGIPSKGSASQIDLGTVMGIGFPAFRGGIIYYANSIGTTKLVHLMQSLERQNGKRFRPVSGILSRAEKGMGFYE